MQANPTDSIGSALVAALPQLRRYALAVCRHPDTADELVQEACERALSAGGPATDATPFLPWMFTILRNRWIDRLRRQQSEGTPVDIDDHPEAAATGGEDERVDARRTLVRVQDAIDRLVPEQRELVLLVCVEEFSYSQAAALVGVPIGTVMSRLARARMHIAEWAGLVPGPKPKEVPN